MLNNNRIRLDTLDFFRFLAILSVMLFHFYSRWMPPNCEVSLYPYGANYDYFKYGKFGVEFFFIISGFVITYTLFNTTSIIDFWKKRLIRLLPGIILASVLTPVLCALMDSNNYFKGNHTTLNYLYSITFVQPNILNRLFSKWNINGNYINGSYWSLWPEVQFYFCASLIFFANRKHFIKNFSFFSLGIYFFHLLLSHKKILNIIHITLPDVILTNYQYWTNTMFNFPYYVIWFLFGVLAHEIFFNKFYRPPIYLLAIAIGIETASILIWSDKFMLLVMLSMLFLFMIFIKYPQFFNKPYLKVFNRIGVASYFLYLIHENIGVVAINKYAKYFNEYSFLFPLLLMACLSCLSLLVFSYFEKPVSKLLRRILLKTREPH